MQQEEYSRELVIENPLGFHVRPVQRFAELAQVFDSDIEVEIEGKNASGKSVMGLMGLGGRCGSAIKIRARGDDARQALEVLSFVVEEDFFVEDTLDPPEDSNRHIDRLMKLVSCFDSEVHVVFEGDKYDCEDVTDLNEVGIEPTSDVGFDVEGPDANKANKILEKLVKYRFYIEEAMGAEANQKGG